MTYKREIPRDLFNEASLLKCYGRIFINLETAGVHDVVLDHDGGAFNVEQDPGSGDLRISNVKLVVRGAVRHLFRPANSRSAWPLYVVDNQDEEVPVFDDDGSFSPEMIALLRG